MNKKINIIISFVLSVVLTFSCMTVSTFAGNVSDDGILKSDWENLYYDYAHEVESDMSRFSERNISGFFATDFDGNGIPEIIAYTKTVQYQDNNGNVVYQPSPEEREKLNLVTIDFSVPYGLKVADGKVVCEEMPVFVSTKSIPGEKAYNADVHSGFYMGNTGDVFLILDIPDFETSDYGSVTSITFESKKFRCHIGYAVYQEFANVAFAHVERDGMSYTEAIKAVLNKYEAIVSERVVVDDSGEKNVIFARSVSDKSTYKTPSFKDITKEDDYTDYILALGYLNLFKGDQSGNFNPQSTITRAEFAALVCRMLGYEKESNRHKSKTVFTDVPSSHWASGYIYVASELGIINGYGNGLFGPEDPVKYEQAIKMIICALEYNKPDICSRAGVPCPDGTIPYPDGYIAIAKKFNVIDPVYKTGDNVPRKVIAKLLYASLGLEIGDIRNAPTLLSEILNIKVPSELSDAIDKMKDELFNGNKK